MNPDIIMTQKEMMTMFVGKDDSSKWEQIGRTVGSLRKGDIVFHEIKGFGEVVMILPSKIATVEYSKEDGTPYQREIPFDELQLVTPLEHRFDQ